MDIFLASAVAGFLLHISEIDGMRCRELKYCSLTAELARPRRQMLGSRICFFAWQSVCGGVGNFGLSLLFAQQNKPTHYRRGDALKVVSTVSV